MATDDIERLHFYQRQYLGALDFEDQQTYHRDMRRRLNLAHHTWGIVTGLELQDTNPQLCAPTDIYITPGMAVDGYGREIVIFMPIQLDVSLFQPYRTITRKWTVCLEYIENYSQRPRSGYEQGDVSNQFGRVQENYRIVLANPNPFRDDLSVSGNSVQGPALNLDTVVTNVPPYPEDQPIPPSSPPTSTDSGIVPYDESLPYQEFPIDDPATLQIARWLIPLGDVQWDGTYQSLIHDDADPPIHEKGRHYTGTVASRLLAPARTLIARDRSATLPFRTATELKSNRLPFQPPSQVEGVKMVVEGTLEVNRTLQVDGVLYTEDTIQLDSGGLDFRDANGTSDGKNDTVNPLFTITRQGINTDTGIDFLFKIGKDQAGHNRFVVGAAADLFTIADNGNAHLAGSMDGLSITGTLDFGSQPRQMITLWASPDKKLLNGIGIQVDASSPTAATTYFRSSNNFYWFKGGIHSDLPGDPGFAGKLLMKLDDVGGLNINGPLSVNGSLTFNGPLSVNGSLTVNGGPLAVTGTTNLSGSTTVNGSLSVAVTGSITLTGPLAVTGNTNFNGPLVVTGPSIAFQSTTHPTHSVMLGQISNPLFSDGIFGSPDLWLDAVGAVIVKQGFRMSKSNGAANFPSGTPISSGQVVVLDTIVNNGTVIPSHKQNDTAVVGVAIDPGDAGFILTEQSSLGSDIFVALMGIVQCKVDAITTTGNSTIAVGDPLTTSKNPGNAQKADGTTPTGAILGKALRAITSGASNTIPVLLMLS